jgi:hypothetical protein
MPPCEAAKNVPKSKYHKLPIISKIAKSVQKEPKIVKKEDFYGLKNKGLRGVFCRMSFLLKKRRFLNFLFV